MGNPLLHSGRGLLPSPVSPGSRTEHRGAGASGASQGAAGRLECSGGWGDPATAHSWRTARARPVQGSGLCLIFAKLGCGVCCDKKQGPRENQRGTGSENPTSFRGEVPKAQTPQK